MTTQAKKLSNLRVENPSPPPKFKLDSVLNLSSRQLSILETNVLGRGFNFKPSLPHLPIVDYAFATEAYIHDAGLTIVVNAAVLRNTVLTHIEKMKVKQTFTLVKSNLSAEGWKPLKSLQSDNSIMIILADKGNKTVYIYISSICLNLNREVLTMHRSIPTLSQTQNITE